MEEKWNFRGPKVEKWKKNSTFVPLFPKVEFFWVFVSSIFGQFSMRGGWTLEFPCIKTQRKPLRKGLLAGIKMVNLLQMLFCMILAWQLCWPEHNMTTSTMLALVDIPVLAPMIDQPMDDQQAKPEVERRRKRTKQPLGHGEVDNVGGGEQSNVDGGSQDENGKVAEDNFEQNVERDGKDRKRKKKEAPKPKTKGGKTKAIGEGRAKKNTKRRKVTVPDDDSDEGGYDDDDDDDDEVVDGGASSKKEEPSNKAEDGSNMKEEACEAEAIPEKGDALTEKGEAKKEDGARKKNEARTEARTKKVDEGKAGKGQKNGRRDQSKSKKFWEVWSSLPETLQTHFDSLSRAQQTAFIHAGIQRSGGHLNLNQGAMFKLVTQREEQQAGMHQMKGYGGLAMFYFPRKVFSKQTILKNQITAGEDKVPDDENAVEKFKDEMMKDDWDPYTLVVAGLDSLGQGNSMDARAMASLSPMASLGPIASLTPSSSLPKFTPSATGGISIHFKIPYLFGGLS